MSQFAAEQALSLGKKGIRVNNVMPGSTDSGMKDEFEKLAGGKEALLNETGVAHRLATPEEMAGPIVFLGSDCASFISGVDLCVDSADRTSKVLKVKKDVTNIPMTNPLVIKMAKKAMDRQIKVK
jgi:NAD(P)-dependent dehydrogenase (short-subunit alcohol dehydrogenase family)